MADMSVSGLDELMDDLEALAALPDSVVGEILDAEADVLVPAQQAEIQKQWRGRYSEGISAKCVKKGKLKKEPGRYVLSVYPQGTRKRGGTSTRNAEIAFINEYGAPGRGIAACPAIGTANAKAEQEAVEAGEKVYHAYLDSKNL